MQCPLSSGCLIFPKLVSLGIGCLGFALGVFSIVWPKRSIGLYQWMMERINWKVAPIDEPREVRITRILGAALAALSLIIFCLIFSCF
jgi:hypothetical protein